MVVLQVDVVLNLLLLLSSWALSSPGLGAHKVDVISGSHNRVLLEFKLPCQVSFCGKRDLKPRCVELSRVELVPGLGPRRGEGEGGVQFLLVPQGGVGYPRALGQEEVDDGVQVSLVPRVDVAGPRVDQSRNR